MLSAPSSGGGGFSSKPRALTCFICGRGYGTSSLEIHIKNCEKKFLAIEAQKPKKERRPLPTRPTLLASTDGGHAEIATSAEAMQAYNDAAFHAYNDQALIKCNNCGRTFLPDSLKHHNNACSAERPFKPLPGYGDNPASSAQSRSNSLDAETQHIQRLSKSSTSSTGSLPGRPTRKPVADTGKPWHKSPNSSGPDSNIGGANGAFVTQQPTGKIVPETAHHENESVSYTREHIESARALDKQTVSGPPDPFHVLRAVIEDLASRGYSEPTELHRAVDEALAASNANQTT